MSESILIAKINMMTEIIIRKAKRENCKAISTLIQELADYEKISNIPKIDYKTLERDGFDGQPLFLCNVAISNEKIIGYTIFYYIYSAWYGKAIYLENIYVAPEFQGKQIDTKLLKAVAKEAVENNCSKLRFAVLNWNPAQKFYKIHGASDLTSEEQWHYYNFSDTDLKRLSDSE